MCSHLFGSLSGSPRESQVPIEGDGAPAGDGFGVAVGLSKRPDAEDLLERRNRLRSARNFRLLREPALGNRSGRGARNHSVICLPSPGSFASP